jgi:hypothetical protein
MTHRVSTIGTNASPRWVVRRSCRHVPLFELVSEPCLVSEAGGLRRVIHLSRLLRREEECEGSAGVDAAQHGALQPFGQGLGGLPEDPGEPHEGERGQGEDEEHGGVEQFDDDRDRQGGGSPVGYLAQSEATLLGPRVARLRRFRAGFWNARPVI